MNGLSINRGDIILTNLEPTLGSEIGKVRPCIVVQNNIGNKFSPTVIVVPITSRIYTKEYPTNVYLPKNISNLEKESTILTNQIRTLDKKRIVNKLNSIPEEYMKKIDFALKKSLDLN